MRRLWCAIGLGAWLFGLPALAQTTTLPVRAGEHADFTRLVIRIPDENTWRVTTGDRSARLELAGPPLRFDLSQTFARIPRTKLRAASAAPDLLELQLACDCDIRASEDIPGFLVIDILAPSGQRAPIPPDGMRPRPRPPGLSGPAPSTSAPAARAGRDLARHVREGADPPPATLSLTLESLFDHPLHPRALPAPTPAPEGADHSMVTRELAQVLARSVAQGVLRSNDGFDPRPRPDPPLPDGALAALAGHVSIPGAEPAQDRHAADRAAAEGCARAEVLDMSRWPLHDAPPSMGAPMGGLVQRLYGEFDRLDTDTLTMLAQQYLRLGFGAEGRMVSQMRDAPGNDLALLAQLGYLIDLEQGHDAATFAMLQDCGPFAYLWAFLAAADETPLSEPRADHLIEAISLLPPHLRLHLGPKVIQRLTLQGHRDIAQIIRTMIDRVAPEPTPALELARVALDLPGSPPEQAGRLEARLAPQHSDEALLFLLAQRERNGAALEPGLRDHAEDRLLALRNSDNGRTVARHLLRAALRMDDPAGAVTLFERERPHLGNETKGALADLFEGLLTQPDDLVLVEQVFRLAPWAETGLPPEIRTGLADRLARLGFAAQAGLLRAAEISLPPAAPDGPSAQEAQDDAPPDPGADHAGPSAGLAPSPGAGDGAGSRFPASTQAVSDPDSAPDPARAREAQRVLMPDPQDATESGTQPPPDIPDDRAVALLRAPERSGAAPETGPNDTAPGLLGQGRDALAQSMALREQVRTLLADPGPP